MKKCCRFLDALEDSTPENHKEWQDILLHAERCPDCSSDMRMRTQILEMLAEAPEPDYPVDLHASIMADINNSGRENHKDDLYQENNLLSRIVDMILQPMEVIIPVACIIMFAFLVRIDQEPERANIHVAYKSGAIGTKLVKSSETLAKSDESNLEKVTEKEVDEFLAQLKEFRQAHPERNEILPLNNYQIELVDDFQPGRTP